MSKDKIGFKPSKVKTKKIFADKNANDEARKLHAEYEKKLKELNEAIVAVKDMLSKSGVQIEYESIITIDDNGSIVQGKMYEMAQSYKAIKEDVLIQSSRYGLNDYNDLKEIKKILDGSLNTNLLKKAFSIAGYVNRIFSNEGINAKVKNLDNVEYSIGYEEILNIYDSINNLYQVYGEILNMDTRSPSEKTETFSQYGEEVLSQIKKGNINVIKSVTEDVANFVQSIYEETKDKTAWFGDQVKEVATYSAKTFGTYLYNMYTSEDKKEIDKIKLEEKEELESVNSIVAEAEKQDNESNNQNSLTIQNYNKPIPSSAIKLTDENYSNYLHKDFQSQFANIIENAKGNCFFGAAKLQEYVVKNCKAKVINLSNEECVIFEKKADIALKNCDTIYKMETKYDDALTEYVSFSASEYVDINADGILYIGAGDAVAKKNNFVPMETVENLSIDGSQQQLLGQGSEVLQLPSPDSAEIVQL
jgi:hypothetical protein